jgi:hypothetical protein
MATTLSIEIGWRDLTRPKRIKLQYDEARDEKFHLWGKPAYTPMRDFINRYPTRNMPLNLLDLLHRAGLQMIKSQWNFDFDRSILAAGPLYLILQKANEGLAFHQMYGDFTSSYSHAIGVAMAVMVTSAAYNVRFDNFETLPVQAKKSMDFLIERDNELLVLEAKGITSDTLSQMRSDIWKKKQTPLDTTSFSESRKKLPIVKLGVITKIGGDIKASDAFVEVVDPPTSDTVSEEDVERLGRASRYMHYAKLCAFSGLDEIANVLAVRAYEALSEIAMLHDQLLRPKGLGNASERSARRLIDQLSNEQPHQEGGGNFVGFRWQLSSMEGGLWISQGIDLSRTASIIKSNEFPSCAPYAIPDGHILYNDNLPYVASVLPSGSYLEIGTRPIETFRVAQSLHTSPFTGHSYGSHYY